MAEINKRVDLNKSESAAEAVLRQAGVRALATSDLPQSEVVGTLSKRVRESKLRVEDYDYLAPKLFGKNMVFDGMLDVKYSENQTTSTGNPYDDVIGIDQFNGTLNKAIQFTYEAKTESNVKTKVLNSALANFKTNPSDAIVSVFESVENINKTQMLAWAGQVWTAAAERAVKVDVSAAANDIEVNKIIYEFIINAKKNSKAHIGVGTDPVAAPGVIEDQNGNTVSPTKKFDPSEWIYLPTPSFETNTVFDGERTFFNWGGSQIQLGRSETLFIDDEEMPEVITTEWANVKAALIHKSAFYGIQDWEGTSFANAGKLYQIVHNYMKQDVVPMYDAPVIIFDATPVAPAKTTKEA